jgi:hypothetical protein
MMMIADPPAAWQHKSSPLPEFLCQPLPYRPTTHFPGGCLKNCHLKGLQVGDAAKTRNVLRCVIRCFVPSGHSY